MGGKLRAVEEGLAVGGKVGAEISVVDVIVVVVVVVVVVVLVGGNVGVAVMSDAVATGGAADDKAGATVLVVGGATVVVEKGATVLVVDGATV